jgi:hypothetical protein
MHEDIHGYADPARGPGRRRSGARLASPPGGNHPGVTGNERLTALTGAILLVLIAIEVVTIPSLSTLLSLHVVAGVLLTGPLVVKIASTGYRFVRYYSGSPPYRRKGPPHPVLRWLAPLLLLSTLVVMGSGFGLVLVDPAHPGPWPELHALSFIVWAAVIFVHVAVYVWRVPKLIAGDWREQSRPPVAGRGTRLVANIGTLAAAAIGALILLPYAQPWIPVLIHRGGG